MLVQEELSNSVVFLGQLVLRAARCVSRSDHSVFSGLLAETF